MATLWQGKPQNFLYYDLNTPLFLDDIYKGRVVNITDSFIWLDIGLAQPGVIKRHPRHKFQQGQTLIVQVMRDVHEDVAARSQKKGVRLSPFIHLAGRYCIYHPQQTTHSFAPCLTEKTRHYLQASFRKEAGFTFRSPCEDALPKGCIQHEVNHLKQLWQSLQANQAPLPQCLYKGLTPLARLVRDAYPNTSFIVDDLEMLQECQKIAKDYSVPGLTLRSALELELPLFDYFGIEEIWQTIPERIIPLSRGGNICIEQTSCTITIDINAGGQTADITNHEAIPVIIDQMRWRGLQGNILIDFIETCAASKKNFYKVFNLS